MTGASAGVGGVGAGRVSRKVKPQAGQWIPEGSRPAFKWNSREQRLQRTVSSDADTEFPSVKSRFGNGMCLRGPILGEILVEGQGEKAGGGGQCL